MSMKKMSGWKHFCWGLPGTGSDRCLQDFYCSYTSFTSFTSSFISSFLPPYFDWHIVFIFLSVNLSQSFLLFQLRNIFIYDNFGILKSKWNLLYMARSLVEIPHFKLFDGDDSVVVVHTLSMSGYRRRHPSPDIGVPRPLIRILLQEIFLYHWKRTRVRWENNRIKDCAQ